MNNTEKLRADYQSLVKRVDELHAVDTERAAVIEAAERAEAELAAAEQREREEVEQKEREKQAEAIRKAIRPMLKAIDNVAKAWADAEPLFGEDWASTQNARAALDFPPYSWPMPRGDEMVLLYDIGRKSVALRDALERHENIMKSGGYEKYEERQRIIEQARAAEKRAALREAQEKARKTRVRPPATVRATLAGMPYGVDIYEPGPPGYYDPNEAPSGIFLPKEQEQHDDS